MQIKSEFREVTNLRLQIFYWRMRSIFSQKSFSGLGFTLYKAAQPLLGMELEKEQNHEKNNTEKVIRKRLMILKIKRAY